MSGGRITQTVNRTKGFTGWPKHLHFVSGGYFALKAANFTGLELAGEVDLSLIQVNHRRLVSDGLKGPCYDRALL